MYYLIYYNRTYNYNLYIIYYNITTELYYDGIYCHLSILLVNSSMMSSKLQYFMISGAIPSIRFSFTLLYSSFVKGPVCIARVLSLIFLICMELMSCSCPLPSSFLK